MVEDRIVREPERRKFTGLSRTTWWVLEAQARKAKKPFPARVKLTGNRVGWRLSALLRWVRDRQPAA